VLKARVASAELLVDLGALPGLAGVRLLDDGGLELGAMTTYRQIAASREVAAARPVLAEVVSQIADVQVRNRGTIGGNLCANDPTNHLPPLMAALGAAMTVAGPEGERTVTAEEFFVGVYLTAVGPGELLTRVTIPPAAGAGDAFASVTVGREGTGIVNVATSVRVDGGTVADARVAIGCVAAVPERAGAMEAALVGGPPTTERVREAARTVGETLDPPSDVHGSSEYRRSLAGLLAARATLQAIERAEEMRA
jgi:carbon-monoxide dehydrogenase medium subunit